MSRPALEDANNNKWTQHFAALVEFQRENGHCRVPQTYSHNRLLAAWVARLRRLKPADLSADRQWRLDELGFDWQSKEERFERMWNEQYQQLKAYREVHGDCDVSVLDPEHAKLGRWLGTQRKEYKKERMSKHRRDLLEALQVTWEKKPYLGRNMTAVDSLWMQQYEKLVSFERKHQHCVVPTTYCKDNTMSLGRWVHKQRLIFSKGELPEERKKLLDELGFDYQVGRKDSKVLQRKWERMFQALLQFKERFGHVGVPYNLEFTRLATWFEKQRCRSRHGSLLTYRKDKLLSAIGPGWDLERAERSAGCRDITNGKRLAFRHMASASDDDTIDTKSASKAVSTKRGRKAEELMDASSGDASSTSRNGAVRQQVTAPACSNETLSLTSGASNELREGPSVRAHTQSTNAKAGLSDESGSDDEEAEWDGSLF